MHTEHRFVIDAMEGHSVAMRFDLHVHTDISPCSRLSLEDILAHGRSLGLDGVCLTDHDTMDVARRVVEGPQADGLVVLVGMEYTTVQGDFLVFGSDERPMRDLPRGMSAPELLFHMRRSGGAVVAAHPFRGGRGVDESLFSSGLCTAMESLNGRNSPLDNDLTQLLRARYSPVETGGSDAHNLDELGHMVTVFDDPIATRVDLVRALLSGRCRPHLTARGREAVVSQLAM